jgi:hypothetical protein
MSEPSAEAFNDAMIQVYVRAKKECNYTARWYLDMVATRGGLQAAKDLLQTREDVQSGLTKLWELGRLDISVENLVLQPEWQALFTREEREVARQRLKDHGFIATE